MTQNIVKIGNISCGNELPFVLIAGPCQIESSEHAVDVAGKLKEITSKLKSDLFTNLLIKPTARLYRPNVVWVLKKA